MLTESRLNRRKGRICILRCGKTVVEDHALFKETHDIRDECIVLFLHFLPAKSIGENVQNELLSPTVMSQRNWSTDKERLICTDCYRFINAIEIELAAPKNHRAVNFRPFKKQCLLLFLGGKRQQHHLALWVNADSVLCFRFHNVEDEITIDEKLIFVRCSIHHIDQAAPDVHHSVGIINANAIARQLLRESHKFFSDLDAEPRRHIAIVQIYLSNQRRVARRCIADGQCAKTALQEIRIILREILRRI